ncbi:ferredoxin--NADP reductase [Pseudothauera rhizosphaerae]|uniref:ferredoxin--NADP(+) reductase n=1 Tax=Pseudothauera rhizosphaerae TaxID=2565932 RepID=A0A4S4AQY0_9RHOO|nr:ferredoxin--NADP reductase [Pseudothauera rhizosphaerae]THF62171.1 ferredoxin--NADP reductase [Pseudothauera rhizosphaerae]
MNAPLDKHTTERIVWLHRWTGSLFSFRTTRPRSFRFVPGQFARLGLAREDGSLVWRAYSMVSAPYDEYLEFFSVVVPGGEFTGRLARLGVGDTILVDRSAYGYLTTDRFRPGRDLWLLATGTGLAPFLSILQDPAVWDDYRHLVLVHSVRTADELAYRDEAARLRANPLIGERAAALVHVPVVTRSACAGALGRRIPALIDSGELEARAGLRLDPDASRIMICGNPQMVRDTRDTLKARGFTLARREQPGQYAVENAF